MRPMPRPKNLEAAVQYVIESNRADGYTPTRFIQITVLLFIAAEGSNRVNNTISENESIRSSSESEESAPTRD